MAHPGRFEWERALRDAQDVPWHVKSLLLIVATYMSENGSGARPKVPTLCRNTGLSRARVFELLRAAEALGWMASRTALGKATQRVPLIPNPSGVSDPSDQLDPSGVSDPSSPPDAGVQPTGREGSSPPDPYHSTNNSPTTQKERTRRSPKADYTADFEEFWRTYERKGDKRTTAVEWHRAIQRADAELILAAARAYVASTPRLRYRKDAQRWLKNDCWESAVVSPEPSSNGHQPFRNPADQSVYDEPLLGR